MSGGFSILPTSFKILLFFSLLVFVISLIYGIFGYSLFDYSFRYILGDGFRYIIPWLGFFTLLVASIQNLRNNPHDIDYYLNFLFYAGIVDSIVTIYLFTLFPWAKISTSVYLSLIGFGVVFWQRYPLKAVIGITLAGVAMIASGKRGSIIAIFFSIIFINLINILFGENTKRIKFYRRKNQFYSIVNVFFCLGVFLLVSVLLLSSQDQYSYSLGQEIYSKWMKVYENLYNIIINLYYDKQVDTSYQSRLDEMNNTLSFLSEYPSLILFGAGFGAEVPMLEYTGVWSDSGRMHHIHIVWGVYLLRNGMLGIILLMLYFMGIIIIAVKFLKTEKNDYAKLILFLIIMDFIKSFKSNIMLEITPIYIALFTSYLFSKLNSIARYHKI
jgi:hypothetical protein